MAAKSRACRIEPASGWKTKVMQAPEVRARVKQLGVKPMPATQPEFAKFFKDDIAAMVELAKAAKIATQ